MRVKQGVVNTDSLVLEVLPDVKRLRCMVVGACCSWPFEEK